MNRTKLISVIFIAFAFFSCHNYKQKNVDNEKDSLEVKVQSDSLLKEKKCTYDSISYLFDFVLSYDKFNGEITNTYLTLYLKRTKKIIHEIVLESVNPELFACDSRSYVTGYHEDERVVDGYYGDLVVADFNFDDKEDFAVVSDVGFTHFYEFFIQEDAKFISNDFLNSNLRGFPEIDPDEKTLTIRNVVGGKGVETDVFKYNTEEGRFSRQ